MKCTLEIPIDLRDLSPNAKIDLDVHGSTAIRQRLADELDVPLVTKVTGKLKLKPWRKSGFALSGELNVQLQQICVVSLDPFEVEEAINLDRYFLPQELVEDLLNEEIVEGELELEFDAPDPPDPMDGETLDIYSIVKEEILISLNPHPRKPGVDYGNIAAIANDNGEKPRESPFAVLKGLKDDNSEV